MKRLRKMELLAACVAMLALPAVVRAQFTCATNNGMVTLTKYTGSGGAVTIPNTTNGYPVVSIGASAFFNCTGLASVTIPASVTNIGSSAFSTCAGLTSVTIPASVTRIGNFAFMECRNLSSIFFCGDPPIIGANPFGGESTYLTVYYLPGTMGWGSNFGGCQTAPNPNYYLLAINSGTGGGYYTNGQIVTITAAPSNGYSFACWTGATQYLANITSPTTTVAMPSSNIVISATYYFGITVVSEYGSPDPSIGSNPNVYGALLTCSVNSPVTAGTTQYLCTGWSMTGNDPGYGTTTNFSMTLTNSAMLTWQWQTQYWLATLVNGSGSVTSGGWCNAGTDVTVTATPAMNWSFAGWSGDTNMAVIAGNGITVSMTQARNIVAIFAPFTFTSNGSAISIKAYTGPGGIVTIPSMIDNLPVTSIGAGTFYNCTSLNSVTIPKSVTNIGDMAFWNCTSLTGITFQGSAPSFGLSVFQNDNKAMVYYLSNTTGWDGSFDGLLTLPLDYQYVTNGGTIEIVFYTGTGGSVHIPETIDGLPVTILDDAGAFFHCTSLISVTIPNSVTYIGQWTFEGCTSLTNVTIGANVSSIGQAAFQFCTSLTSMTIPASVNTIGKFAFVDCTNLTSIYFCGAPPVFGAQPFYGDASLYYLPGITSWGANMAGCRTVLWNPQVVNDATFGVQANQFGFTVKNAGNPTVVIEACTNLTNPIWIPIATNTLVSGSSCFSDSKWTNYPTRYYRLSLPQ